MADGTTQSIKDIQVGDQVQPADPETGETSARTVAAVSHHPDTVLDLKTDNGATVTTTEDHPFWNATDHQWQQAQQLDPGDQLSTTNTHSLRAVGLDPTTIHTATALNRLFCRMCGWGFMDLGDAVTLAPELNLANMEKVLQRPVRL